VTLPIASAVPKVLERKQAEIDQLALAARAALDAHLQFRTAEEECAGRIDGITAEIRQLQEMAAQRVYAGNPLDMDAIRRLEATKRDLLTELPIRRRVAEVAINKYKQADQVLNETRAEHMRIANAAAVRAARERQVDGWQGDR